jgi:hypothetical protein
VAQDADPEFKPQYCQKKKNALRQKTTAWKNSKHKIALEIHMIWFEWGPSKINIETLFPISGTKS